MHIVMVILPKREIILFYSFWALYQIYVKEVLSSFGKLVLLFLL